MDDMEEFKKDLLESELYKKYILNNKEPICVYVSGSRCINLETEESDYDLVVLVEEDLSEYVNNTHIYKINEDFSKYGLTYKKGNKHVHWYYSTIYSFISNRYFSRQTRPFSTIFFNHMDFEKSIIYINPKYKKLIDFLIENKKKLTELEAYRFYFFSDVDERIKFIHGDCYLDKATYSAVCASYLVQDEEITEEDKEFLIRAKKIYHAEDDDDLINQVYDRLVKYKKWIYSMDEQNDYDYQFRKELDIMNTKIYLKYQELAKEGTEDVNS